MSHPFELDLPDARLSAPPVVLRLQGRERVNSLYRYWVHLALAPGDDLPRAALGSRGLLRLEGGSYRRAVQGVVLGLRHESTDDQGRRLVAVQLGPRLALLRRRSARRVFQEMTVLELAQTMLAEWKVAVRLDLDPRPYAKRVYSVQYDESDYAFVMRHLAEAGVVLSFDHAADVKTEIVVLTDAANRHADIEGARELVYRPHQGSGMAIEENHVTDLKAEHRVRSERALNRAFDFERPLLDLRDDAKNPINPVDGPDLLGYEFGGQGDEAPPELPAAATRLQQLQRGAAILRGTSACRRLTAGRVFALGDTERPEHSRNWIVERMDVEGVAHDTATGGTRFEARFVAVGSDTVLRPARPRRKLVQVTETAWVVGPQGKEIHTDAHGRVKVQFHWDLFGARDDKSSCWLRVAHAWAGRGFGTQALPRVGMEVLVTFLGGDVDRPIVTGCVYDAMNPVPFALPTQARTTGIRTQSTPGGGGFHELSFDDTKGKERLFVRAEKDRETLIQHDDAQRIGGERTVYIGTKDTLTVGVRRVVHVGGQSKTGSIMEDGLLESSTGGAHVALSGDDLAADANGTVSVSSGGNMSFNSGADLDVTAQGNVVIEGTEISLSASGNINIIAGGTITLHGADVVIKGLVINEN